MLEPIESINTRLARAEAYDLLASCKGAEPDPGEIAAVLEGLV